MLHRFIENYTENGNESVSISKEAVTKWNNVREDESYTNRRIRVNTIRAFAEYLSSKDVAAYIGEPIKGKSDFVPYIFSNEELARLFHAADSVPYNKISQNRWLVMPMILRTIYSCGLRVSEATNLRTRDVDLDKGIVRVWGSKFDKDRLIPTDNTLHSQLKDYAEKAVRSPNQDSPFFPAPNDRFYCTGTIYGAFRGFLWKAGISHGGKGRGPRLHDLRHTFAVHCLRKWVSSGVDLTVALPYLSAFMGHGSIYYSQLYLRLTAEMYPDIVSKMETKFDVIPNWEGYCETN